MRFQHFRLSLLGLLAGSAHAQVGPLTPLSGSMSTFLVNTGFPGHDFSANACIDGVWGGGSTDWSFCHNDYAETNAWLSVEVAPNTLIASVDIHGRSDCCQANLGTYQIWVGSTPGDPTSVGGMTQCQPTDVLTVPTPATVGPFTVTCGLVGTYVTLLLPGTSRQLMIDELVPVGRVLQPSPPSPPRPPAAPCGGANAVSIDFATTTNPAVTMQWTDASGQVYNGSPGGGLTGIIPSPSTDTTGGAFPGGSVRWTNLGTDNGVAFDLLVTVSATPSTYADTVTIAYSNPLSSAVSQAVSTSLGYVCLGFGMLPSTCASGSALDASSANCVDGTPTTLNAGEFDFTFVQSGTTTQMPPFERSYLTFFDVDGDVEGSNSLYELVSVLSPGVASLTTSLDTTLQSGTFSPSNARFVVATQTVNVPTDFAASPATPSAVSLPAIVAFDLVAVSTYKVLLAGRSAVSGQEDRGYCFTMVFPSGLPCTQGLPPPPSPPTTPPPATPSPTPPLTGAKIELTGQAPKIHFGPPLSPTCTLSLDPSSSRMLSSCEIVTPSNGRRLVDGNDNDGVPNAHAGIDGLKKQLAVMQAELAELRMKTELAELRQQKAELAELRQNELAAMKREIAELRRADTAMV